MKLLILKRFRARTTHNPEAAYFETDERAGDTDETAYFETVQRADDAQS